MTLNGRSMTVILRFFAEFGSFTSKWSKIDLYSLRRKCSPNNLLFSNISLMDGQIDTVSSLLFYIAWSKGPSLFYQDLLRVFSLGTISRHPLTCAVLCHKGPNVLPIMSITPLSTYPCTKTPCLLSHFKRLLATANHKVGDNPPP